jgi:hypothetical protein
MQPVFIQKPAFGGKFIGGNFKGKRGAISDSNKGSIAYGYKEEGRIVRDKMDIHIIIHLKVGFFSGKTIFQGSCGKIFFLVNNKIAELYGHIRIGVGICHKGQVFPVSRIPQQIPPHRRFIGHRGQAWFGILYFCQGDYVIHHTTLYILTNPSSDKALPHPENLDIA